MKKLIAIFTLLTGLAGTAQAVELRREAVITGEEIRLGDLFAGLPPETAGLQIAPAPAEGREVVLEADWIVRVANAYDVDWQPGYRVPSIVVRGATEEERQAAASDVRRALERVIAAGAAPVEDEPEAVEADAASEMVDVAVPGRRLRSGEVIGADDIAWISVPAGEIQDGMAIDADELIGMSPRRVIAADQPVRRSDLRAPLVVHRGDSVAMVLQAPGLQITARGRSLVDGAVGDVVRVVNIDSNRTIDAVVTGPGTVAVVSAATLAGL
ncbi:MAG: flagellar basal body P-ring formation protein FlgA [Rhodospirillaceae bacterium]|nr:flagellar basal body P-ring formation protein FlgA [Rhodospirillaceae bacterium]